MSSIKSLVAAPVSKLRELAGRLLGTYRAFRHSNNPVYTRLTREGWQFWFMIAFILLPRCETRTYWSSWPAR